MTPYLLGIAGGMGPLAGVELQRLIIEAMPAQRDQDHIPVLCYTNPQIPDRSLSLAEDGGTSYFAALRDTCNLLAKNGVTEIALPCNASHARLDDLRASVPVPFIDMVLLTKEPAEQSGPCVLLAAPGTYSTSVYQSRGIAVTTPDEMIRSEVALAITEIKAGMLTAGTDRLEQAMATLSKESSPTFILGCTERSLAHQQLSAQGYRLIDPLRLLAADIVRRARS